MNLDQIKRGQEMFNARQFFECHEYLEGIWMHEKGDVKILLQGLIQVAAAMYKLQKDKSAFAGALYLMDHGLEKIEPHIGLLGAQSAALAPLIEIRNRVVAEDVDVEKLPTLHLV